MPKAKPTISYNTHGIENALQWDLALEIQREHVGRFCRALSRYTSEALGAILYYPDLVTQATTCRYEWFVGKGRKRFLYRLGLLFTVANEPLTKIRAYVGYGDAHPNFGTVPVEGDEITLQLNRIIELLRSLEENPYAGPVRHTVSYIEIPHGFYVGDVVQDETFRVLILPTVLVGKGRTGVSAVISMTSAGAEDREEEGINKNLEICALLTLATGTVFKGHFVEWQKRLKPVQSVESIDPVPNSSALFPPKRWKPWSGVIDRQFGTRLDAIVRMFSGLHANMKGTLRNAILAYRAGLEMLHPQPALASVAFVAALGFLARRQQCQGIVECRTCGPLANFHHELVGERASLFQSLTELFEVRRDEDHYQDLNGLLKRIYREQRSAYVHSAKLRDRELGQRGIKNVEPTATAPYSDEFLDEIDLRSMEALTRRAIIKFLQRQSGVKHPDDLFGFDPFKVLRGMSVSSQIALPANVWVKLERANPGSANAASDS